VFGGQAAVEVALRVGNSDAVRAVVIGSTFLKNQLEQEGRVALQRYLQDDVEVRSLRGGIIVIEMEAGSHSDAQEIVAAYQRALQIELARISEQQTAYMSGVLEKLVQDASDQLASPQAAFDSFRLNNQYADPRSNIAIAEGRALTLEATILSREVDLATARRFYTDRSVVIQQKEAELAALRQQLAQALQPLSTQNQSLGELVQNSSELARLERDLEIVRTLYCNYLRYLRGTSVEDLTADGNLRILEEPHVVTERQYSLPALAPFIAILLLWVAVEAYRIRPVRGCKLVEPIYD
jgi:capsule polysaccharide export protein KpsE/RkpR